MDFSEINLRVIVRALDTQARLLDARLVKTPDDELLQLRCQQIRDDIETYLLSH